MAVHGGIIFRYFLKEVDQSRNVRECFDSGLYHSCNLLEVVVFLQNFFHIRKCSLIEFIRIHFLDILTIHPTKFRNIKYCRRFIDMMIIKCLYQFIQCKDLSVVRRTPSEKCHIVDDRFWNKSLIKQVFIRGMSTTFGKLLVCLICDQRTMYINRDIPSESFVDTVVFRSWGKILVTSYYVCDLH